MNSQDVFPKKLSLAALIFLVGIFVFLLYTNSRDSKLLSSFHSEEIPSLQVFCGATRLIGENEVYHKTGNSRSEQIKTNQMAILYSLDELIRVSENNLGLNFDLKSKTSVQNYKQKSIGPNSVIVANDLKLLKADMQDFIEAYLKYKNAIFEGHIKFSQIISVVGLSGMILFFLLMIYVYRLYRRNLQELDSISVRLENQRISSINASKLASLGEMAAGLAHEINNPLAVIQARVDILMTQIMNGEGEDKDTLQALGKVNEMSQRISKIVTSMRKVSRGTSILDKKEVNVSAALDDVLNLIGQNLKNVGVELSRDEVPIDSYVFGDFNYITQIFINLINNAVDELKKIDGRRQIIVTYKSEGNFTYIKVSDNGRGIPGDMRERIFEPFYTNKEVGKGTGLGLSICSNFAKEMGGELYVEDNPLTTFVLKLPRPDFLKEGMA